MTKKTTERPPLRIVSLTAENVKKIRAVHIEPSGALVQLTGANGSGKSSVLDSIWWALKGAAVVDPEPIRTGEERATVRLDFGSLVVTRVFTRKEGGDFTTSLKVESDEGALFPSPQKLLDSFLGSLSFDPLEFMEKDEKGQLADLRRLVNLEVDLELLDGQNAADFSNRTEINRQVKSLQEKTHTLRLQLLPGDETVVDTTPLVQKMADASRLNQTRNHGEILREAEARSIADHREKGRQRRERAAQLIAEAEELERLADEKQAAADKLEPLPDVIDTTALLEEIRQTEAENVARKERRDRRERLEAAEKEWQARLEESETLTNRILERNDVKAKAIADAKMPVEGLGFGEGVVTFNGLPLKQASTGEQWSVSLAIAGAMNPTLRVILIRQGALLDSKRIKQVADWAEANGYQVWMERVEESGKVGVVMEDGAARVAEAAE